MCIVKDLYDILKEEPEVRDWIKKNAKKLLWSLWGRFTRREPTINDVLAEIKTCIDQLPNDAFTGKFRNHFSFLEFLFTMTVRLLGAKERGVLISDFYAPNRIIYFPLSTDNKKFERHETGVSSYSGFVLRVTPMRRYYYYFYAITGNYGKQDFPKLREMLDDVVRTRKGEPEQKIFEQKLKEIGLGLQRLEILNFNKSKGVYSFLEMFNSKDEIILESKDPSRTRQAIAQDLTYLYDYVSI